MKSFLRLIIAIFLFAFSFVTNGQTTEKCAVIPYMEQLRKDNRVRQSPEQFEQWIKNRVQSRKSIANERRQAGPYQIPVVVHVIHNGEPIGTGTNISDAQIISQIDVLNKDFQRMNTDKANTPAEFLGVAGAMDIEFILAKQSPQGLPTSGIVRVVGSRSSWPLGTSGVDLNNNGIEDFKEQSYWPAEDYLNIWVVKSSNAYLGYSQFPISNLPGLVGESEDNRLTDGVVMDYLVFGTIDAGPFTLDSQYNLGRTLTHEVGHFLGLRHIWGDTNECSPDDFVNDTPTQGGAYIDQCPSTQRVSCSTSDMYQNYLDYTDDACMNLFTIGQIDRMEIILDDSSVPRRHSLLSSNGLNDPGCSPDAEVDAAIVSINQPSPVTCSGTPDFKMTVQNVSCPIITDMKVSWSVAGVNSSKTFSNLSIKSLDSYTLDLGKIALPEGLSTLSVVVDELNGQPDADNSNSDTTYYLVRNSSNETIPIREDFNNNSFNNWSVVNPQNGLIWDLASTGTQYTARFAPFLGNEGDESWLASPVLNFSFAQEASLFFDVHYSWANEKNDRIRVMISDNCGDSYGSTTIDLQGLTLAQSSGRIYLDLSSYAGHDSVRVAFVATNATGDDIFVDNIEFYVSKDPTPLQIDELFTINYSDLLRATITFDLPNQQDVRLVIYDMMGRVTQDAVLRNVLNQTYDVELGSLSEGIYIFKFWIGNRFYIQKVLLKQ